MKNGVLVAFDNKDLVLIESNESYFLFAENSFVMFANFFSDILNELFRIEPVGERVIFEIIDDLGLPKIRVTGKFKFHGKENGNDGFLEGNVASLGMTYFFQRHLSQLLSGHQGFSNFEYLDALNANAGELKAKAKAILNLSEDEEYQLYKLWD